MSRAVPLTQLSLEIDLHGEPVSGRVGLAGAEPLRFTGYSGLIAALESIRSGEPGTYSPGEGASPPVSTP